VIRQRGTDDRNEDGQNRSILFYAIICLPLLPYLTKSAFSSQPAACPPTLISLSPPESAP
jgi:hypothetical protein